MEKLSLNINQYMKRPVNEQAAVISDNPNDRLKQYLDNEDLLEKLSAILADLEDGEQSTHIDLQISGKDYGILDDDILHVKVDKSDPNSPKFTMWVMNEEFMFGDVDLELAANMLYQAGQEGNALTYVGNAIGSLFGYGDAGDAGTDEDTVAGIAGAIASIARDKDVDPNIYFDKMAEHFKKKHGSLVNFLEEEFSGNAEAVALNVYRQPISDSWTRGFSLGSLLGDIALTIGTFGIGTFAKGAFKGANAVGKTLKYAGAGSKAVKTGSTATKGAKYIGKLTGAWNKLSKGLRSAKFKKAFKVGDEVKYINAKGVEEIHKVTSYTNGANGLMIKLGNNTPVYVDNLVASTGKAGGLAVSSLAKVLPSTATKVAAGAGLAAKKGEEITMNADASGLEVAGEILGWYDSLAADPSQEIAQVKQSTPQALAEQILQLKNGSGIWGNTTNQEELMMALIITSVTHEAAAQIEEEYNKLDPNAGGVLAVLKDELGGDEGLLAQTYWAGCLGLDDPNISKAKARINKAGSGKSSKPSGNAGGSVFNAAKDLWG